MGAKSLEQEIFGQKSFVIQTSNIRLAVTQLGGHMAPVTFFRNTKKTFEPYRIFPWWNEGYHEKAAKVLTPLRGDFFCMPFGANIQSYRGENHPPHGETSSNIWSLVQFRQHKLGAGLQLQMQTKIRKATVTKKLFLRENQNVIYCRHEINGASGRMCYGHHATIAFPDIENCGLISVSRFIHGQVYPGQFANPADKEYSILKPGAKFINLSRVPRIDGIVADLSRYPTQRGYEDLLMVCSDPGLFPAWTAVVFPKDRNLWFSLKDPNILASTVFWLDNGGRHAPPWNGRSINTLGLEEITGHFDHGLAVSASQNPLKKKGIKTDVLLSKKKPFAVNYILVAAKIPTGFRHVKTIKTQNDDSVLIRDINGKQVKVEVHWPFLKTGNPGIPLFEAK